MQIYGAQQQPLVYIYHVQAWNNGRHFLHISQFIDAYTRLNISLI